MAIKKDQIVTLHYILKVDGNIVNTNADGELIKFTYGSGELISGLEKRISDMNIGETKEICVPANEAYGEYDETLFEKVPKEAFDGIDLQIGLVLEADTQNGDLIKATVTEVSNEEVTMDYNHPLAGCDLDFMVTIKKIE